MCASSSRWQQNREYELQLLLWSIIFSLLGISFTLLTVIPLDGSPCLFFSLYHTLPLSWSFSHNGQDALHSVSVKSTNTEPEGLKQTQVSVSILAKSFLFVYCIHYITTKWYFDGWVLYCICFIFVKCPWVLRKHSYK